MLEIKTSFNKMKNILYKKNEKIRTLEDLAIFIQKTPKTVEELKLLNDLKIYVKSMIESMNDLGTKIFELNANRFNYLYEGLDLDLDINCQIRNLIIIIDQFIDGLSAIIRNFNFNGEHFELKKTESYIKHYRNKLIKKFHEYTLKNVINNENKDKFYLFVNDVIDIIIKEGYKLRLKKLYEVLSRD